MTEKQASEKKCKKREEAYYLRLIAWVIKDYTIGEPGEIDINCEGRQCAHWNATNSIAPISTDDIDDDGTIATSDVEYLGYCGFTPPIEELTSGLNNQSIG